MNPRENVEHGPGMTVRTAPGRRHRTGRWVAAFLALTLVAAACGDDDDAVGGTGDTPTATVAEDGTDDGSGDEGDTGDTAEDAGDDPAEDGTDDATPEGDTCTEERKGGQITIGTTLMAAAIDTTVALGTGVAGALETTAFYDTLLRYVPETGAYEPHVAESLTPNDDLTEWTLVLKDGIFFGNGDPLTSDAVKFSVERLAGSTRAASGLAQELSIAVVDDLTMTITTRSPNGSVPYTLSGETGMIVNPTVVEALGDEDFANNPTGAGVGPYELERFAPGEEIVLKAKDDYWGGPVCIDSLRFINVPGSQGTWDAFRNGEMNMAFLTDRKVINEARAAGAEAFSAITGANGNLLLNNREGSPTADPRVRRAISMALDTVLIDERVVSGEGLPSTCLAHPDMLIHPDVDCPIYDVDAARALVEEAKADGWDGEINVVFSDIPDAVETSIVLEALLIDIGMTVNRENLPQAEQSQRVLFEPYEYDIGAGGLSILDSGPIARINQFLSDSVRNRSGYASDEMDAAIRDLQAAVNLDETIAAMAEIQTIWNEDVPNAVYNSSEWFIAADDTVHGLVFSRDVVAMFHDAYVE